MIIQTNYNKDKYNFNNYAIYKLFKLNNIEIKKIQLF